MQEYAQLVELLPSIESMGYVKTHRRGNTGVGKTLEDLLSIRENNFTGPNGYMTELKSGRKGASALLTLFTKSPLPRKINRQLVEKFGTRDENNRLVLHTTVNAITRNTLYGRPGFVVKVQQASILLDHSNYGDLPVPYWNQHDLESAFRKKYPQNLLYVKADHRGRGIDEHFHYNEAWLMSGFSFKRFIELLMSRHILVDIRLGRHPDGRLHDHGTGFRVSPGNLDLCFDRREQIL